MKPNRPHAETYGTYDPQTGSWPPAFPSEPDSEPAVDPEPLTMDTEVPADRLALLGRGGMGEVEAIEDPAFGRRIVRKVLRADANERWRAWFLAESRLTAWLDHPGVVSVHGRGALPDGRPYFTMQEVRGRTLAALVADHRAGFSSPPLPVRLIDAVERIAETLGYAHTLGVVHRDIKPGNIMVGAFGEVMLLDWGAAAVLPDAALLDAFPPEERASLEELRHARIGTPAYMAPEQGRGLVALLGPRTDVFALGVVLRFVLTGAPFSASDVAPPGIPPELWALCKSATSPDLHRRPPDGRSFAAAIASWRDGDARRQRARERVSEARVRMRDLERLRAEAAELGREARIAADRLKTWDDLALKRPVWALEDSAAARAAAAELEEIAVTQLLGAAVTDAPDLDDPHRLLADLYRAHHEAAESARDAVAARRWEALLQSHDRGEHRSYLQGRATLSLQTEPEGAEVQLYALVPEDRRLVPRLERALGRTPLVSVEIPAGSWLLQIRSGAEIVRYPVLLGRGERFAPPPLPLPPPGALGPDDVYIPAGPAWIGGGDARNALARQRIWIDGLVMRRNPVTVGEYIEFLDDLVAQGREAEALVFQPLREGKEGPVEARAIFGRDAEGRFRPVPDAEGDVWDLGWPMLAVSWEGACAYAAWLSERDGLPWRLPSELEREKAGRGADGRLYPWGDAPEPLWSVNGQRQPGHAKPATVTDPRADESIYGVRGLAGNARDWCLEPWSTTGLWIEGGKLILPAQVPAEGPETWRVLRGGAWSAGVSYGVLPQRLYAPQNFANYLIGFRLAYTPSWISPQVPRSPR